MLEYRIKDGKTIRLSDDRWQHIVQRHPEMADEATRIAATLEDPDLVQQGDYGARIAIRLFPKTTLTSKYVVVVYRETNENDGFIITAYLTSQPAEWRDVLWRR